MHNFNHQNTVNTSLLLPHRSAQIWFCLALAPLILGTALAADPERPAPVATNALKTHVLFIGADIAVEKDKAFHHVEDVTPTALVIRPGGRTVEVPLRQTVNLQINELLKIAGTSAGIGRLKFERDYTLGADPFQKIARSATLVSGNQVVSDIAQNYASLVTAQAGVLAAAVARASPETKPGLEAAYATVLSAQDAAEAAMFQSYQTQSSQAHFMDYQSKELGERFDAIRVTFEVTPEKDLVQPYYAVIAQIREADSKPDHVRKWGYIKQLGSIGAGETRKVTVFTGGMPPGYILEGCEVHLYDRGEELATNLSRKRVPLTDEETLEFRIIEYVGANKGRTLPAVPATKLPADGLHAKFTPDQLVGTYYARVTKGGHVTAVFRDAAGRQPLQDPLLEPVLKTLRFKPALESGKPVEQIAPVTLGDLAR